MVKLKKLFIFSIALLLVIGFNATKTIADGSTGLPDTGDGSPPKGLAISSNAPGVQLKGVLFIEYVNFDLRSSPDIAEMARVVLRLRRNNQLEIFYKDIAGPLSPVEDPGSVQNVLMSEMLGIVIPTFFPDEVVCDPNDPVPVEGQLGDPALGHATPGVEPINTVSGREISRSPFLQARSEPESRFTPAPAVAAPGPDPVRTRRGWRRRNNQFRQP